MAEASAEVKPRAVGSSRKKVMKVELQLKRASLSCGM